VKDINMSNGRKICSVSVVNLSAPRIQGSCGECHFFSSHVAGDSLNESCNQPLILTRLME